MQPPGKQSGGRPVMESQFLEESWGIQSQQFKMMMKTNGEKSNWDMWAYVLEQY
jgi:hypothetical protein